MWLRRFHGVSGLLNVRHTVGLCRTNSPPHVLDGCKVSVELLLRGGSECVRPVEQSSVKIIELGFAKAEGAKHIWDLKAAVEAQG